MAQVFPPLLGPTAGVICAIWPGSTDPNKNVVLRVCPATVTSTLASPGIPLAGGLSVAYMRKIADPPDWDSYFTSPRILAGLVTPFRVTDTASVLLLVLAFARTRPVRKTLAEAVTGPPDGETEICPRVLNSKVVEATELYPARLPAAMSNVYLKPFFNAMIL
jgi:hypothetical protein